MKPKHFRLYVLIGTLLLLSIAAVLILNAAKDGVMYYKTPSELIAYIQTDKYQPQDSLRLGGLVAKNTYVRQELRHLFKVTDGVQQVDVIYTGIVPALFAEGQGAVVDGRFDGQVFQAVRVLAKHDENYRPPKTEDIVEP